MIIHVLTVEPLAPACTISCRELLGNGLCKPTGIQALDMRDGERESNNKRKDQERMEAHAHTCTCTNHYEKIHVDTCAIVHVHVLLVYKLYKCMLYLHVNFIIDLISFLFHEEIQHF